MDVRFFQSPASQSSPVKEYLRPLSEKQRLMVGHVIRAIQNGGPLPASAKAIANRSPLCELSIGYHRIFYVVKDGTMWLLHAVQKDAQKANPTDLDTAERRIKEIPPR